MKKITIATIFLLILGLFLIASPTKTQAEAYTTFEEMVFENNAVTTIDVWGDMMTNAYLGHLTKITKKKKMFGWNIMYVARKEPFTFVAETMYHVKNEGKENITHSFTYEETQEQTIQRSVKGSMELQYQDEEKKDKSTKFKFGLEAELEFEYKQTDKTKKTKSDTVKITIAPNSELFIKVKGRGYIYNGVGRKFFFWIKSKEGAFEYVIITTEYYEIEMTTIGEEQK